MFVNYLHTGHDGIVIALLNPMRTPKNILVVGDLILDVFHHGAFIGNSLSHAKTPVAFQKSSSYMWGGAGFVVRNILALGGRVSFVSALGADTSAELAYRFQHPRLKKLFLKIPHKPTTVKQRFWVGEEKVLNWHQFNNTPISKAFARKLLARVRAELPSSDTVIIADYRHGLLSHSIAKVIVQECARRGVPLYIDSQITYDHDVNHGWYAGASVFCLNLKEARSIDPKFDSKKMKMSLMRLQKSLRTQGLVVKLGAQGSAALIGAEYIKTSAHKVKEVDATGAGDSFISALSLGAYSPTRKDLECANIWAALSTTKIGTVIPSVSEFRAHRKRSI